ncbi:MAG: phosphonate ABC transporter substrate-binding protein [Rubrimonas sp.]|uniref:phosphonate ABC transporter substrate-binding protein n=1 Tax=Rubrimonas sp. TaxID=2036015 RepID=UPI002FDCC693
MKLTLIAAAVAAIAGAASAQEITEFRVGILGGENASDRLRSNECIRVQLEELLGVPTKVFAPADYNGVIEGILGGNIDMAWLGPSAYAKVYLTDPEAAEPVLVKVNVDGSFGYHAIAFARADSGITSFEDMKGKVFALGDPNSTSGYLIPAYELNKAGYSTKPGEYFSDVVSSGGHEQSIVGVYNGDFPASVTWADGLGEWEDGYNSGALRKAADAGLVDMTQLVEIWKSPVIVEGPIVLRKSLPERVKIDVTGHLASLGFMDPECAYTFMAGEVKGLKPINHAAYENIIEVRRAAGN